MKVKNLIILIAVVVIVVVIIVATRGKKNDNDTNTLDNQNVEEEINETKKLEKSKTFEGLEVYNIVIESANGVTTVSADIKNVTKNKSDKKSIDVKVLDGEGNELTSFAGEIAEIDVGETTTLKAAIAATYKDAQDVSFVLRKEE